MTNDFLAFAPTAATPTAVPSDLATAVLDETMARVGVDGLIAAIADPAVLAVVDQHAAAVRDALTDAGREFGADALASYARSIAAAAKRMNRPLPMPGEAPVRTTDWINADWHLLRLVAVCALADEAGLI